VSGAERERGSGKSGEREWSGEREAAERRAGVTKIGLSGEREIGRSRTLCSHALVTTKLSQDLFFIYSASAMKYIFTCTSSWSSSWGESKS